MSMSDDEHLAARLARGEEAAFAELYDACADRLLRYVATRVGSADAAADVVQDVFLRAVRGRKHFRKVESPVAYVFQIARNETVRRWRAAPPRAVSMQDALSDVAETPSLGDDAEVLQTALGRLTAEDREIVDLKVYAGLTFREIADVLAMPLATVATRYRRALESLRPWVAKQLR